MRITKEVGSTMSCMAMECIHTHQEQYIQVIGVKANTMEREPMNFQMAVFIEGSGKTMKWMEKVNSKINQAKHGMGSLSKEYFNLKCRKN